MRQTPVVFLLLLAIAFGLSAGPHPCHGKTGTRRSSPAKAGAAHAPCHGAQPSPKPASRKGDCCDPVKGRHLLCDEACQGAAVLGVASALPAVLSFEELAAVLQDRPAPPFVLPIDHVPLT